MFIMTHKPYRWLQLLMQLLLLIHYSHAQGIVVPDDLTVYPAYPCTDTQSYFDTVSMKCVKCDTVRVPVHPHSPQQQATIAGAEPGILSAGRAAVHGIWSFSVRFLRQYDGHS
jgi:hypothetical protein